MIKYYLSVKPCPSLITLSIDASDDSVDPHRISQYSEGLESKWVDATPLPTKIHSLTRLSGEYTLLHGLRTAESERIQGSKENQA